MKTNIMAGGYLLKKSTAYTIEKTNKAYKLSYNGEVIGYPRTQRIARNAIRHHEVYGVYSTKGRE